MKYLSLFSGIEAASVAWEPLGWKPVAFCEIDPFPSAVLAHRWPDVPNLGDVTRIDWSGFKDEGKRPDVIVGGSPCQSFSVAGGRAGLAGASGLVLEYVRAVREILPDVFVWENVPGALSSEGGEAFRRLLSEMDACGYGLAWRVLDSQFARVPLRDGDGAIAGWIGPVAQRRERVFLVGCLGDPKRAGEILFEPGCLQGDHPTSREKRKELAAVAGCGVTLGGRGRQAIGRSGPRDGARTCPVWAVDRATTPKASRDVCHTLRRGGAGGCNDAVVVPVCLGDDNAHASCDENLCGALKVGGSAPIVAFEDAEARSGVRYVVRRIMPVECERLQGFPDGHTDLAGADADALFERMAADGMDAKARRKLLRDLRRWCKSTPDGPRYKAVGNSMAVPVMRDIGAAIEASAAGERTGGWR